MWSLGYEKPAETGEVRVKLLVNLADGRQIKHSAYLEAASGESTQHFVRQAIDDCLKEGPREVVFTNEGMERRFKVVALRRWRRWHFERCVDRTARWMHNRLGEVGLTKVKYAILSWNNLRIVENPGRDWKVISVAGDDVKVLPGDLILAVTEGE